MNELATIENHLMFDDSKMSAVERYSQLMASSKVSIPDHLRGSAGDCMAICMQALKWGMDPFAVSQKTHLINGRLGYEAQLISAVISSSKAISGGFKYEYGGDWERLAQYAPKQVTGKTGKTYYIHGWPSDAENGLWCRCGAVLKGEDEPTWGEKVYLRSIVVRNSTNWTNDPRQQMAYTAQKRWSRLYAPEVILGVYTADEIEDEQIPIKEMGKVEVVSKSESLSEVLNKSEPQAQSGTDIDYGTKIQPEQNPEGVRMMTDLINDAKTLDELNELVEDIKHSSRLSDADRGELRQTFMQKKKALEAASNDIEDLF